MSWKHQLLTWLGQSQVWHQAETQRMVREASALGLGLSGSDYNKPFPGTTNVTNINLTGLESLASSAVGVATGAGGPPATSATATVSAPPPNKLGQWASNALLGLALVGGGAGIGSLLFRPTPTVTQPPASVPAPPVAPSTAPQQGYGLRVRIQYVDTDGKLKDLVPPQQVSPTDVPK